MLIKISQVKTYRNVTKSVKKIENVKVSLFQMLVSVVHLTMELVDIQNLLILTYMLSQHSTRNHLLQQEFVLISIT
jgi:hypothetical protein